MTGKYELIENAGDGATVHALYAKTVAASHPHLASANVALVWRHGGWVKGGHPVLGSCKKASDCDFELAGYDFVITLASDSWDELTAAQKAAVMDHECSHAGVELNEDGSIKTDDDGKTKWRIVPHDLEEFAGVVERHGVYLADIQRFVEAATKRPTLFDQESA